MRRRGFKRTRDNDRLRLDCERALVLLGVPYAEALRACWSWEGYKAAKLRALFRK